MTEDTPLQPAWIIEYVRDLHFAPDDIDYLRSLNIFDNDFLEYLRGFHFTGDIYAIPEGTVVFPREPLLKVIAPVMEAQLVETAILNLLNHQSLIATKASRVVYAAKGDGVMEFGLRRAQGPDAGIYGARAAMIGGCIGTSNVLTGQMFDVPVKGTHAHSWIMSFPDEYTAFKTYSKLYPDSCILLVDTYDVLFPMPSGYSRKCGRKALWRRDMVSVSTAATWPIFQRKLIICWLPQVLKMR